MNEIPVKQLNEICVVNTQSGTGLLITVGLTPERLNIRTAAEFFNKLMRAGKATPFPLQIKPLKLIIFNFIQQAHRMHGRLESISLHNALFGT
ncbi:hypothetical protein AB9Q29_000400 (plasmid) [Pantoea vagans]|uniref:hypothetical protein n=1 Tax=Pantoea vagans TaxID=470934 RepID=UPI0035177F24